MRQREEGVIVLPAADEMLQRLIAVNDHLHFQGQFYPILLKDAGRELSANGIVLMLFMAIYDYTEGMPPIARVVILDEIPQFIDALVTDPKLAEAAKAVYAKAMQATQQGKTGQ